VVQFDPDHQLDPGRPGASARAEFARRSQRDDARRQQVFGRYLARLVKVFGGPKRTTEAWDRGGRGEELVGNYLARAVGDLGLVLHDRAIPGWRSNIDHIAVVPSGVWVIDTKQYRGRVQRRDRGGWCAPRPALLVNGHDRSGLVAGAQRQSRRVQEAVPSAGLARAVLCFAGAEWAPLARPFTIDGVVVTGPRQLARSLVKPGRLTPRQVESLAAVIAGAFPPYAPSGTSHRPTGAPPKG